MRAGSATTRARILPLETGVAHFARLADVPVLPTAIIGTRWIHLRSRIVIRIGAPVRPEDFPAGKDGLQRMTALLQDRLQGMLEGVPDRRSARPARSRDQRGLQRPRLARDGARALTAVRGLVFQGPSLPLRIADLVLDPPAAGEVLVRMLASGVCHSDLHVVDGDWERPAGVVLGHEGAGVVEAIGPATAATAAARGR